MAKYFFLSCFLSIFELALLIIYFPETLFYFVGKCCILVFLQVDSGLKDDLVLGDPNAPRFVLWNGKLRPVPSKPTDLPFFDLMSFPGKLRAGFGALGIRPPPPVRVLNYILWICWSISWKYIHMNCIYAFFHWISQTYVLTKVTGSWGICWRVCAS